MKGIFAFCRGFYGAALFALVVSLAAGSSASAGQTKLKMIAWNYQVETVEEFIGIFEEQNPDIDVDIEFIPSAQYVPKVMLTKNSNTDFDVLYTFDHVLSQWASWLEPLDGYEGAKELKDAMLPVAAQSMSYDGKLYGLPYFTSYFSLLINEKMMREAGFAGPPKTYAELAEQSRIIKEKGLSKAPMIWPVKFTGWGGMWVWYAMTASRGGVIFDENLAVTPVAMEGLKWWADSAREGLTDAKTIELDPNDSARAFMSGEHYSILTGNFFAGPAWANKEGDSKVAGNVMLAPLPEKGTTVGFARIYAMNSASKHKPEAWRLLQFFGGKTPNGEYATPKRWVESGALTWGYKGLENDPDIKASLSAWTDPAEMGANLENAVHMSAIVPFQALWYAEWETYATGVLQEVLAGRTTPEDAATALSDRAKALERRYK